MCPSQTPVLLSVLICALALNGGTAARADELGTKYYRVVDGKVDARTYNGFRRYHAGCNHCHGPDGVGSMFGPPLVDRLPAIDVFRHIVRDGVRKGNSVMQGFSGDENVAPYIDDIYAYLQARADGMLGRGRPARLGQ
jgi:mono/diheme cytochrome c family protein